MSRYFGASVGLSARNVQRGFDSVERDTTAIKSDISQLKAALSSKTTSTAFSIGGAEIRLGSLRVSGAGSFLVPLSPEMPNTQYTPIVQGQATDGTVMNVQWSMRARGNFTVTVDVAGTVLFHVMGPSTVVKTPKSPTGFTR